MRSYCWPGVPPVLPMLAALLLAACSEGTESPPPNDSENASQPVPGRPGKTFVYACTGSLRFTARIEGETAWLFLSSGTINLPHVEAASGAKYSDGSVTFWTKGESAMLERENQPRIECNNDRKQAIWEDAKLRGADFRATGNEPGWHMEISSNDGIMLVTDYGAERYQFAPTKPSSDAASRTTTYEAKQAEHELTVSLEPKNCVDSMSGEKFETTVTVVIDDVQLNGCGKPLH